MKKLSDLKSDVVNNYKRNPEYYVLTELKDTDASLALPDSGRIKPISAKAAKEAGLDMDTHSRAVEEFNLWKSVRTAPAKLKKAEEELAKAKELMAALEEDGVVIPMTDAVSEPEDAEAA